MEYGAVVWDPYQSGDIDKIEKVQRSAARFIAKDYRSRHPGSVTNMLHQQNLPRLQNRRKQLRLTLLYKVVEGLVPALPVDQFLTPAPKEKRKVKAKTFDDCVTSNPVAKYQILNNRGFKISSGLKTEQFKHSFFIRTAQEWNALDSTTVNATSVGAFTAAAGSSVIP